MIIFGGRFQPFHKGHMYTLRYLSKRFEKVVLAMVCVPEFLNDKDLKNTTLSPARNPLTFLEREEGVKRAILRSGLDNVVIIPVMPYLSSGVFRGLNNSVLPKHRKWFVALKSEEEKLQIKSYYNELGDDVIAEHLPKDVLKYSSKIIRENIVRGRLWRDMVPYEVFRSLMDLDIEKRLLKLFETYGNEVFSSKATRIIDFEKILKEKFT